MKLFKKLFGKPDALPKTEQTEEPQEEEPQLYDFIGRISLPEEVKEQRRIDRLINRQGLKYYSIGNRKILALNEKNAIRKFHNQIPRYKLEIDEDAISEGINIALVDESPYGKEFNFKKL